METSTHRRTETGSMMSGPGQGRGETVWERKRTDRLNHEGKAGLLSDSGILLK